MDQNHVKQANHAVTGEKEPWFFYVSESQESACSVFHLALQIANQSVSDKNRTTAVASLMSLVHPGFKKILLRSLESLGIAPRELLLPSNISMIVGMSLEFEPKFKWPTILLCFICCVILLFKSFNEDRFYQEFMGNRINAIKIIAGIPDQDSVVTNPFNFTTARTIHTQLGAFSHFKGEVIRYLLAESENSTTLGYLAKYLVTILAWSDMNYFTLIFEKLLFTRSCVVEDFRIKHEVTNLYILYKDIIKAKHPQFFRYMEGLNQQSLWEREKFQILYAVALKIKTEEQNCEITNNNIQVEEENELVTELYNQHVAAANAVEKCIEVVDSNSI